MPKIKPIKLVIIVVCIAIIAVLAWKFLKPKQQQPQYITAEVTRGILRIMYLQPVRLMQPSSLVSVLRYPVRLKRCMCSLVIK